MKSTIEFSLPNFDGFYHSLIDISEFIEIGEGENMDMNQEQYDSIDWKKTEEKISKKYLDKWLEKNQEILEELGLAITFKEVESPKEYNFRTDSCICIAEFESEKQLKQTFKQLSENNPLFPEFIKSNYSSYSGFISFYSHDWMTWLEEYLRSSSFDDVIFTGYLNFLTESLTDDEKIYDVIDNYHEFIEYV